MAQRSYLEQTACLQATWLALPPLSVHLHSGQNFLLPILSLLSQVGVGTQLYPHFCLFPMPVAVLCQTESALTCAAQRRRNSLAAPLFGALCLAENCIGPAAYRPDDIITMHSGEYIHIHPSCRRIGWTANYVCRLTIYLGMICGGS